ncbi:MAG: insulinase family protein [Oleibacter sp.]|nr:insulinase family protein [Thalassolituus sp.]
MLKPDTLEQPIVSPADNYQYRYLELENGLRVTLVNAPESDKASAAMSVSVGSMDDPENREGLAHFLEHMLFLGTEPYPEADAYQEFIKQNGGSHNAFTSYRQTTYFFDIDNDKLEGAIDRFAPFFISPTFDAAYVDREKNAVHAEYSASLKEDGRRIFSAEKMAMNPDFSFSNFATGNLDTLSDRDGQSIRSELIDFYKKHYSSDRMTLVIAGDYSLDTLENWTRSSFAEVPKRDVEFVRPDVPWFIPGQLPLDMNIAPIKELRRLQFTFPMPEVESKYRAKPLQLISSLLGHEGEGSILAALKEKGWAEGLSAGMSLSTQYASSLQVSIQLTRDGLLHIDDITQMVLDYAKLMRQQPLPEYLAQEQKLLNEMTFRFQEHGELSQYAIRLTSNMMMFPVEDIIYGNYRMEGNTEEIVQPYLARLTANNMLRTLIAPGVSTDTIDPWYGTDIQIRPSDFIYKESGNEALTANLYLPKPNPFIPENLEVNPSAPQSIPKALVNNEQKQVWYYPDNQFDLPKTQMFTNLNLPSVADSAQGRVLASLYARAVNEALNTFSYPASLAGLNYNLGANTSGLTIALGGYQDKLPILLTQILDTMTSLTVTPSEFDRYRASLKRSLENKLKARPYQRTLDDLKTQVQTPSFDDSELLTILDSVSLEQLLQFSKDIPSAVSTQVFVHGALSENDAVTLAKLIDDYYPANQVLPSLPSIVKMPNDAVYASRLDSDHPDQAMTLYVQGNESGDYARAKMGLLAQILSTPYYQLMRTEKQLGYIVFASAYPRQDIPGLIFIVQSPTSSVSEIWQHTQEFLTSYRATLDAMPEDEFELYKQGLISLLTEKPKNMGEKATRFWSELTSARYQFDSNIAIAERVSKLTKAEILALYDVAFPATANTENRLAQSLFIIGNVPENTLMMDTEMKSKLTTFPAKSLIFTDDASK